ncbi:MAG TPA: transcriptional repressor [Candidatus Caccoplasma merdavium]|nr:transcriptional repressor [Candidatus Caccoplasma merdavium]
METIDNIKLAGLRITPQRKAVYEAMMELRHASIDEIIKKVQSKDGEMTVSTIYRILNSFCTANLLSNIFNPDAGKSYYDITVAEHHHVFKGEQVMDYMDDELTAMIRKYLKNKNFASEDIEKVQVQIIINEPKSNP